MAVFRKEEEMKRTRIGRSAKMLCPVCREVKAASQENETDTVLLECGHSRTPSLLAANGVSLEDIVNDTPASRRLFPPMLDAGMVDATGSKRKKEKEVKEQLQLTNARAV